MKKTHLTLLLLMLIMFAGCKTDSNSYQLTDYPTLENAETSISYSSDDKIIEEEIRSTAIDLTATANFEESTIPENAIKDDKISFDKAIIENFFLGVWRSDDEREFIIGENVECDAFDFFNSYGLIKETYLTENSAVIVCQNFISDCYRIEINFDAQDTILFYDEYESSRNDRYTPRKYARIDDAEMYSDTGIINNYIISLLYFNYDYLELNVNIESYSNDVLYFNGSNTSRQVVVLKSCDDNKLVFISSFINVADNSSEDIVFIEFEKIKVDDKWQLGSWKIVDDEELVQFEKNS